ncbi:MAG: hypothetical protein JW809_05860 [Pirellulales bacterium]|nr:hypothetical protein [Pirellulales bacterium]
MRVAPWILCLILVVVSFSVSPALAGDGTAPSWSFQWTGYQSQTSQTAVAMRDGQTWPVIFGRVKSAAYGFSAISLLPVKNPETNTYWHPIATGLFSESQGTQISAKTSPGPDDRFAVLLKPASTSPLQYSAAVFGPGGSRTTLNNVNALAFDCEGNLHTGDEVPDNLASGSLMPIDIAVSPAGDIAAVDQQEYYYYSTWTDAWYSEPLPSMSLVSPYSISVVMDSVGRPYVVGARSGALVTGVFNIAQGGWQWTTLATTTTMSNTSVALAADGQGGVGLAWAEGLLGSNGGVLRYAYNATGSADGWDVSAVASTLTWPVGVGRPGVVHPVQSVGLAFDAADNPVISFVTTSGDICLAYDPVVAVPEPAAWLMALGGLSILALRRRRS